jgi:hypothetical protein
MRVSQCIVACVPPPTQLKSASNIIVGLGISTRLAGDQFCLYDHCVWRNRVCEKNGSAARRDETASSVGWVNFASSLETGDLIRRPVLASSP